MLDTHVREASEVAEEPAAHETEQGSDVHLRLLLGQPDPELRAQGRQAGVHVADNVREQLVEGLEDKLDEATLGGPVRRLLGELPGLGVEVDVSPQPPSKLADVDVAVGGVVQRGEGLEGKAGAVLGARETNISLKTSLIALSIYMYLGAHRLYVIKKSKFE